MPGGTLLERLETQIFLTLAEELHFGRTAERLRITTGRVSQVIKKLERRIGSRLFDRNSRAVRLTAIGRQLADRTGTGLAGREHHGASARVRAGCGRPRRDALRSFHTSDLMVEDGTGLPRP